MSCQLIHFSLCRHYSYFAIDRMISLHNLLDALLLHCSRSSGELTREEEARRTEEVVTLLDISAVKLVGKNSVVLRVCRTTESKAGTVNVQSLTASRYSSTEDTVTPIFAGSLHRIAAQQFEFRSYEGKQRRTCLLCLPS